MMNTVEIKNSEPDYIHSSNALFSFMKKAEYLEKALSDKAIAPRYCEEDIEYLDLRYEERQISKICVLQKCFCDIPLHRIASHFPLTVTSDKKIISDDNVWQGLNKGNTHTDFYGEFGIAFSKSWAKDHNFQPVQYVNPNSAFAINFKKTFEYVLNQEEIHDLIVSDIIARLAYFKPLFGEMTRTVENQRISFLKNFYDECEWRVVPTEAELEKYRLSPIIFDEETQKLTNEISNRLSEEKYRDLWLNFDYQDIRYLIVPDNAARKQLIEFITGPQLDGADGNQEKYLLISKILVLNDIKRDF